MKRENALKRLGLSASSPEAVKLSGATVEELETAAASKKDYLSLVAERQTSAKCSRMEAHDFVRKNNRAEYNAHRETGFTRKATAVAA